MTIKDLAGWRGTLEQIAISVNCDMMPRVTN